MGAAEWIAAASGLVSVLAVIVAMRSNARATRANEHADKANQHAQRANELAEASNRMSRDAQDAVKWESALEAVNALVNFNYVVPNQDVSPFMSEARIKLVHLSDWIGRPDVSNWLAEAWRTAALLMREATEATVPQNSPDPAGAIVSLHAPVIHWLSEGLMNNIRFMRTHGITEEQARNLEAKAKEYAERVRHRNGWEDPFSA